MRTTYYAEAPGNPHSQANQPGAPTQEPGRPKAGRLLGHLEPCISTSALILVLVRTLCIVLEFKELGVRIGDVLEDLFRCGVAVFVGMKLQRKPLVTLLNLQSKQIMPTMSGHGRTNDGSMHGAN